MNRRLFSMLLVALIAPGCMAMPKDLDLSSRHASRGAKYVVDLRPRAQVIPIDQMHEWIVALATPAGEPVLHAQIDVDGGMPQHGHGLPTKPRVTRELGDGRYLIEGVKFSMPGWWELRLQVNTAERGSDAVTFNTIVALPAVAKN